MERKTLELLIDEKETLAGVEAVSLVAFPAIEENFVFFSKDTQLKFATDDEKRLLVGPALIPNKQIPRIDDETGEEYDVFFSNETVRQAMELFMRQQRTNEHTVEHQAKVDGVTVVESWIIEDPKHDKSKLYGFELPKGTWMLSVKVNNDAVWKGVKERKFRGFSIEGYFTDRLVSMEQEKAKLCINCPEDQETIVQLQRILMEELRPVIMLGDQPLFEKLEQAKLWADTFGHGSHKTVRVNGQTLFQPK